MSKERAQAAWNRIEELGGHGVWEPDVCVVSLANTGVVDDDLVVLADVPVQILDLSNNPLTDDCLKHLEQIESLESLALVGTEITATAIEQFKSARPNVDVRVEPIPKGTINPFTGEPFS